MKAAIYARFSSTLQDGRSIDDQVRICRERAERDGYEVADVFADYAISGSVRERPGLNAMLARAGEFDFVIAEALDRISRDQEDIAGIWKRLNFAGARLVTLGEGEISELHIGFTGTMSALFLTGLAAKIRRGQRGRVEAGRIPGNICYGYRKVSKLDAKGEPERGLREIDPEQAAVVRRIYDEHAAGLTGLAIAKRLNAEGVPAPKGGKWLVSMIRGDGVRLNGILRNPIYAGRLVYNRTQMVRDPSTRRRVSRVRPQSEWVTHVVPELAIVTAEAFEAAQAGFRVSDGWSFRSKRAPRKLLSGLLQCGQCGGSYIIVGGDYWGCGNSRAAGTCTNHRKVLTADLERRVLSGLQQRLLDPALVKLFVREFHEHSTRIANDARRGQAKAERKLADAQGRIDRLVTAIASGMKSVPEIAEALDNARAERDAMKAELGEIAALPVIALHPGIADEYRRQVDSLSTALADDPNAQLSAVPAIRSLIESVTITPADAPRGVEIEVSGRIASIIALATGKPLETGDFANFVSVGSGGALRTGMKLAAPILKVRV